jgi:hypothetical protein
MQVTPALVFTLQCPETLLSFSVVPPGNFTSVLSLFHVKFVFQLLISSYLNFSSIFPFKKMKETHYTLSR